MAHAPSSGWTIIRPSTSASLFLFHIHGRFLLSSASSLRSLPIPPLSSLSYAGAIKSSFRLFARLSLEFVVHNCVFRNQMLYLAHHSRWMSDVAWYPLPYKMFFDDRASMLYIAFCFRVACRQIQYFTVFLVVFLSCSCFSFELYGVLRHIRLVKVFSDLLLPFTGLEYKVCLVSGVPIGFWLIWPEKETFLFYSTS